MVGGAEGEFGGPKLEAAPADKLLTRLRDTAPGPERALILDELARRGVANRELVLRARDEEEALHELLVSLAERLGQKRAEPQRSVDAPWVEEKYRLALERYAAADLFGALRVAEAVLDLEPDCVLAPKLSALRRRCQDRLLETSLVTAELSTSAAVITPRDPLQITLRFKNVSDQPIVLHQAEGATLGVVYVDYEELSADGTRSRVRTQHGVSLPSPKLRLGAGQIRSVPVRLAGPHRRLPPGVIGRYELSGRLRPSRMEVGDSTASRFLVLEARRLAVVARKDLELAQAPRASFAKAVEKANRGTLAQRREPSRQAFVSAVLYGQRDREAALEALIDSLSQASSPLSSALCAALSRVNGEPLSYTRDEWLTWWTQRLARPKQEAKQPSDPPRAE
ncbi:MAG TPA: hypothetical protein DEA08_04255 [Planctomycetes bacterium]|nr:hypothetical protein [Planctomycetota bacterium]